MHAARTMSSLVRRKFMHRSHEDDDRGEENRVRVTLLREKILFVLSESRFSAPLLGAKPCPSTEGNYAATLNTMYADEID